MEMVGGWCHENLVAFPVLVAQLLQLHRSSSLLVLLPMSYLSLLDMGITSRLATTCCYDVDLFKVSGKRQSRSQLG